MDIGERISRRLAVIGEKPASLARATGLSRSAISQWRSGRVTKLKPENLVAAADFLKCEIRWLAVGAGPESFEELSGIQSSAEVGGVDADDSGTVGARIAAARKRAGLTQGQLAASAGVTQQAISFLENDLAAASKHVTAIASALGLSAEDVVFGASGSAAEIAAILAPLTQPQRAQALRMLRAFVSSIDSTN